MSHPMEQTPRHVYIDLGTNWGDTLDLFRKGLAESKHVNSSWEVYGFEAVPLLMPYLDQLVQWKNGIPGARRPVTCEPPVGSTKDRLRFAPLVGCKRAWPAKANFCMDKLFSQASQNRLNRTLLNHSTVVQRLHVARQRPSAASTPRARYTFIPAAAGGHPGTIRFSERKGRVGVVGHGTGLSYGSRQHMASTSGSGSGADSVPVDVQVVGACQS